MENRYNILTVIGPTASGKTSLATKLASRLDGIVISGDSRQVYRGMDIGTGKDLEEYTVEGKEIPYRLIDIVDAGEKYTLFNYQQDFIKVFKECTALKKTPVLCGGSGLYVEAVLKGYRLLKVPQNPVLREELSKFSLKELTDLLKKYKTLHNTTETDTCNRAIRAIEIEEYYSRHGEEFQNFDFPEIRPLIIGIDIDRETRRRRISERLAQRLENGMTDEVKSLLDKGIPKETLLYYGLEYKYITLYLTGSISYREMVEQLTIAIHQFAKRQMTWFRKMEREGFRIHWIKPSENQEETVSAIVDMFCSGDTAFA